MSWEVYGDIASCEPSFKSKIILPTRAFRSFNHNGNSSEDSSNSRQQKLTSWEMKVKRQNNYSCPDMRLLGRSYDSISLDNSDPDYMNPSMEEPFHGQPISYSSEQDDDFIRSLDLSMRDKQQFGKMCKSSKEKMKRKSPLNMQNHEYILKSELFHSLFSNIPDSERLVIDYSCALHQEVIIRGRLYVSQNYFCFYGNLWNSDTLLTIRCYDISSMNKDNTTPSGPNSIQICTEDLEYHFSSFSARNEAYFTLFRVWQNALADQPMSFQELWDWIHQYDGQQIGLTGENGDGNSVSENTFQTSEWRYSNENMNYLRDTPVKPVDEEESVNLTVEESRDANKLLKTRVKNKIPQRGVSTKRRTLAYPKDVSDSTESDQDDNIQVTCPCEKHEGKEVLNSILHVSVDKLFSLIFNGSEFYQEFQKNRQTKDILETDWQPCQETGEKTRQVKYTVALNISLAKSAHVTETQTLTKISKEGVVYVVTCEVSNTGVPYSDSFCVMATYCLIRITKQKSRLRIHGYVHYKKSLLGMIKAIIEKTTFQGFKNFCADLERALTEVSSQNNETSKRKMSNQKRIRRHSEPNMTENQEDRAQHDSDKNIGVISKVQENREYFPFVVKFILYTLLFLLFFNTLLFYKLWCLERENLNLTAEVTELQQPLKESFQYILREDCEKLVQHQEMLYSVEAESWSEILSDTLQLTQIIQKSLIELQISAEHHHSGRKQRMVKTMKEPISKEFDKDKSQDYFTKISIKKEENINEAELILSEGQSVSNERETQDLHVKEETNT
ncbi:GRAM domain-containing protein 1B-like [Limulus polyphemus]|uniref:GRAM domain-containing protein 1B-like n=1 Tax=Limulus polyphemus TaxID=6850 RepID=A0ABM1TH85_LIMPO|nr:GRAM domain-containing protein 1B-like [Limulus polyphemus]